MALTYNQQQERIREGIDLLLAGHSFAKWKNQMTQEGLYPYDIDRLRFQLEKELGNRCEETMQPQIKETATAVNNYGLADDVFAGVLRQQQQHFRKLQDARVRILAREDYTPEAILQEVVHPLYNMDDVEHVLLKERKRKEFNEAKSGIAGASGSKASFIGAMALAAGVTLSSVMSGENYVTVFYGIILFGLYMIGKGFIERQG